MRLLTLLILIGLVPSLPVLAKARYRVGVESINYLPYYNTTEKNEYEGFSRDVLDLFAKFADIELEYVPLPLRRLSAAFLREPSDIDFKFPDNEVWHPSRKKNFKLIYSQTVVRQIDGIIMHKSWEQTPDQIPKIIGMVSGFVAPEYLKDIRDKKIVITFNNNLIDLLHQVLLKRVDAAYLNVEVAKYILKNKLKKHDELFFNDKLPHTFNEFKLSTVHHPQVIETFNEFLGVKRKEIEDLKRRYDIYTSHATASAP